MKDLYTFDASESAAIQTYDQVQAAYYQLFKTIGVPFVVAEAESGNIGGDKSHEYHYLSLSGEDKVLVCGSCKFHLGTRYSEAFNAFVTVEDPLIRTPIQMGCHGIGISRLVVAIADICRDSQGLCWPVSVAPWETVIVTAGQEEGAEQVWDLLKDYTDVVIDDRQRKLGWKLKDAEAVGYPLTVIVGRGWPDQKIEIQTRKGERWEGLLHESPIVVQRLLQRPKEQVPPPCNHFGLLNLSICITHQ